VALALSLAAGCGIGAECPLNKALLTVSVFEPSGAITVRPTTITEDQQGTEVLRTTCGGSSGHICGDVELSPVAGPLVITVTTGTSAPVMKSITLAQNDCGVLGDQLVIQLR
jgi:hypothetical protein